MSLDSFFGAEGADGGISAEKVREFQERMARNAKQMAAARKQEGKQKKKEDKLVAILVKFIKGNTRTDITLLVARCFEQNIPAVFILSIIMLGNEEIQREMGINFHLEADGKEWEEKNKAKKVTQIKGEEALTRVEDLHEDEMKGALVVLGQDSSLPLKVRIAIDLWSRSMWDAMEPIPERMFKTATEYNEDPKEIPEPKDVVNQLAAFILRDFFAENKFEQAYENVKGFADFLIKGLFKRLKDQTDEQKQLGSSKE